MSTLEDIIVLFFFKIKCRLILGQSVRLKLKQIIAYSVVLRFPGTESARDNNLEVKTSNENFRLVERSKS